MRVTVTREKEFQRENTTVCLREALGLAQRDRPGRAWLPGAGARPPRPVASSMMRRPAQQQAARAPRAPRPAARCRSRPSRPSVGHQQQAADGRAGQVEEVEAADVPGPGRDRERDRRSPRRRTAAPRRRRSTRASRASSGPGRTGESGWREDHERAPRPWSRRRARCRAPAGSPCARSSSRGRST